MKGTGLVGAVEVTEQQGYAFENVAGTSAGAIIALFIAAGYTAQDFFSRWSFEEYKARLPQAKEAHRRERVWSPN